MSNAISDSVRQDYTALANTWTHLADVFECDNALLKGLGVAGSNVVPLTPRQPKGLVAAIKPYAPACALSGVRTWRVG
jgi:hypothetical protein